MPPKPKFTREEIVSAALGVVSRKGVDALTAKELGDALGSSARPIFTIFRSMKELQDDVRTAAMQRFEAYMPAGMSGMPIFKQIGMKMVLFGAEEPKLFQLLFMQENRSAASFDDVFAELGPTADLCIDAIHRTTPSPLRMRARSLSMCGSTPSVWARCVPPGSAASRWKSWAACCRRNSTP